MTSILNEIPDVIYDNCIICENSSRMKEFIDFTELTIFHINIRLVRKRKKFNHCLLFLKPYLFLIDIITLSDTRYNGTYPYRFFYKKL